MYLLLKLSRINIKNHPVAKRLYQYRKVLSQFDPVFEETIKPQIEILLQENECSENLSPLQKNKTLKVLRKLSKRNRENLEPPVKKQKVEEVPENSESADSGVEETEIVENPENKNGMKLKHII